MGSSATSQQEEQNADAQKYQNVFLFFLFFRVGFVWVIYPDVIHLYLPLSLIHTRIQSNFQLCFFSFFDSFSKKNPPLRPETISHFDLNRNITHKKHFSTTTEFSKNDDGQTILIPSSQTFSFREKIKKERGRLSSSHIFDKLGPLFSKISYRTEKKSLPFTAPPAGFPKIKRKRKKNISQQ